MTGFLYFLLGVAGGYFLGKEFANYDFRRMKFEKSKCLSQCKTCIYSYLDKPRLSCGYGIQYSKGHPIDGIQYRIGPNIDLIEDCAINKHYKPKEK